MKEAAFYKALSDGILLCELCPHLCRIAPEKAGFCRIRENRGGKLIATSYCRPATFSVDPIEKKPLFHFHPGTEIFSAGQAGCNFRCGFCQNFELSQSATTAPEIPLDRLVDMVTESGTIGIAYTYSEPTIWFETVMAVGSRVRERGLKNVMVSNGYVSQAPLAELLTVVDAWNIDIKSMNPSFYRTICKGNLKPVLAACEAVKRAGSHLEITFLLIPGENESPAECASLADFIAGHLGADTPLHISRYFPRFHMDHEATSLALLTQAYEIARKRLDHVYVGNVFAGGMEQTFCPRCGEPLISRHRYATEVMPALSRTDEGQPICGSCGKSIAILM